MRQSRDIFVRRKFRRRQSLPVPTGNRGRPTPSHAANTVILSVEEVVDESIIRSDPNRTIIHGAVVDSLVEQPYGSHPSYVQGHYDRDNAFYREWSAITESHASTCAWLDEWVTGTADHDEYLEWLGTHRLHALEPETATASPVDMGRYDEWLTTPTPR